MYLFDDVFVFFYVYVVVCIIYMYENDLIFYELKNFIFIKEIFFKCLLLYWIYEWLYDLYFLWIVILNIFFFI